MDSLVPVEHLLAPQLVGGGVRGGEGGDGGVLAWGHVAPRQKLHAGTNRRGQCCTLARSLSMQEGGPVVLAVPSAEAAGGEEARPGLARERRAEEALVAVRRDAEEDDVLRSPLVSA